jgi:hypothetical protein
VAALWLGHREWLMSVPAHRAAVPEEQSRLVLGMELPDLMEMSICGQEIRAAQKLVET